METRAFHGFDNNRDRPPISREGQVLAFAPRAVTLGVAVGRLEWVEERDVRVAPPRTRR